MVNMSKKWLKWLEVVNVVKSGKSGKNWLRVAKYDKCGKKW